MVRSQDAFLGAFSRFRRHSGVKLVNHQRGGNLPPAVAPVLAVAPAVAEHGAVGRALELVAEGPHVGAAAAVAVGPAPGGPAERALAVAICRSHAARGVVVTS